MNNVNSQDAKRKVIIIGLDGATFDLITPWVNEGKLPVIGNLIRNGTSGNLTSVIPALSAPAWVSFMTGKNPGKHGVLAFQTTSGKDSYYEEHFSLVTANSYKDKTLWEILSINDTKVGVVNVPVTYPPKKVNGFLISCFLTPPSAKTFTYPAELKHEIPDYRIDLDFVTDALLEKGVVTAKLLQSNILNEQYNITEKRANTVLKLIDEWYPDFFMVVFKGTDNLQHFFWDDKELLLAYYQKLDDIIHKIIDKFDKNTDIFIISDHGFGPQFTRAFFVNKWLQQEGFLKFKGGLLNSLFRFILFIGIKINQIIQVRTLFPKKSVDLVVDISKNQIDWSKTKAYGDNKGMKGININLKNREKRGIVAEEEYEKLVEDIIAKLKTLKDPKTGEIILKDAFRNKDLYSGPHVDKISDIVLLPNHNYTILQYVADEFVQPLFKTIYTGNHENGYLNGILVAYGPDIKKGHHIAGANLVDIAPTVLHIMNNPISKDTDGKVLTDIFQDDSSIIQRPVEFTNFDEEEYIKEKVKKLKGLKNNLH